MYQKEYSLTSVGLEIIYIKHLTRRTILTFKALPYEKSVPFGKLQTKGCHKNFDAFYFEVVLTS